jgi:hypothetical protein
MKHEMQHTKLRTTENCDRGCCATTYYKVTCTCGHVFDKDTSTGPYEKVWRYVLVDHRLAALEGRP